MLRFILWMIMVLVAAKIVGQIVRYIRHLLTPNKDVLTRGGKSRDRSANRIEDIPYEEIKEKK